MTRPGRILVVDDEPYITDVVTAVAPFRGVHHRRGLNRPPGPGPGRRDERDLMVLPT